MLVQHEDLTVSFFFNSYFLEEGIKYIKEQSPISLLTQFRCGSHLSHYITPQHCCCCAIHICTVYKGLYKKKYVYYIDILSDKPK